MARQSFRPHPEDAIDEIAGNLPYEADAGLHAAAEWLLRRWKEDAWLKQVDEEWVKDKEQRKNRLDGIQQTLAKDKGEKPPQWYFNGQGQAMVVIPVRWSS